MSYCPFVLTLLVALAHSSSLNNNITGTDNRMESIMDQLGALSDPSAKPIYGFTPKTNISANPAHLTPRSIIKSTPSGPSRTTSQTSQRPLITKVSFRTDVHNATKPRKSLSQTQRQQIWQSYRWSLWSIDSDLNLPRVSSYIPRPPSQTMKEDKDTSDVKHSVRESPAPWREYWTKDRLKQRRLEQMWRVIQPEYNRVLKEIACIDQNIASVTRQLLTEKEAHATVLLELNAAERKLNQDVNQPYPYALYARNQRRLEDERTRLASLCNRSGTRIGWLQRSEEGLRKRKAQLQMDNNNMLQRLQ
eukprot:411672_1